MEMQSDTSVMINVTAASAEDASLVASVIGQQLTAAGFTDVAVQPSMMDSEESIMDTIRSVNPGLFGAEIQVNYDEFPPTEVEALDNESL